MNKTVMLGVSPVLRTQLPEQVMERIKEYIRLEDLQPDARLPGERELARALGVSRTVMREALHALQATGILDIQPGTGIFVAKVGFENMARHLGFAIQRQPHHMDHLVEARVIFERGVLELVAKNATPEQIDSLEEVVVRMENSTTRDEEFDTDCEFHQRLVQLTGNPVLLEFTSLLTRFFREGREVISPQKTIQEDAKEHRKLMKALKQKKVALAQAILEKGIRGWNRSA